MHKLMVILSVVVALTFSAQVLAKEPVNLKVAKQAIIKYYTSGEYNKDVKAVVIRAQNYARQRIAKFNAAKVFAVRRKKLAVVFDIDDTLLSTYSQGKKLDFGGTLDQIIAGEFKGIDPAVPAVLKLYNYFESQNVTIFLVTGRREKERGVTIKNLQKVGCSNWSKLYMKPASYHAKSVIPFKSGVRKVIEAKGYDIILNMGDQYSDLAGGYADGAFKLPNPMYFIP